MGKGKRGKGKDFSLLIFFSPEGINPFCPSSINSTGKLRTKNHRANTAVSEDF